jgi:hypothetical protein
MSDGLDLLMLPHPPYHTQDAGSQLALRNESIYIPRYLVSQRSVPANGVELNGPATNRHHQRPLRPGPLRRVVRADIVSMQSSN